MRAPLAAVLLVVACSTEAPPPAPDVWTSLECDPSYVEGCPPCAGHHARVCLPAEDHRWRCACSEACAAGFLDCNGDRTDGCETDVFSDEAHCGACGRACPAPPNASPLCELGLCHYDCLPGFGDCDEVGANGCENTLNTNEYCGSCNSPCDPPLFCDRGSCQSPRCGPGSPCPTGACCDGVCRDLSADLNHCGACGVQCVDPHREHTAPVCRGGRCGESCLPNYPYWRTDCDGDHTNGCEVSLATNDNCGACGRRCPKGFECHLDSLQCLPGRAVPLPDAGAPDV